MFNFCLTNDRDSQEGFNCKRSVGKVEEAEESTGFEAFLSLLSCVTILAAYIRFCKYKSSRDF